MNEDILLPFSPIIVNTKPSKKETLIRYFECHGVKPILITDGDMFYKLKYAIEHSHKKGLIPLVVLEQYVGSNLVVGTDIFTHVFDCSEVCNGIVIPDGSDCIKGQIEILESIVEGGRWRVGYGTHPIEIRQVCREYIEVLIESDLEYINIR